MEAKNVAFRSDENSSSNWSLNAINRFYPEFYIVGVPCYPIEQKKNYIEHENIEKNAFVIIKADTIFNKEEGKAIYRISYTDNQIKFNAFAKLKQYGDSVIIKLK